MSGYWQGVLTLPVLLIAGALVWLAYTLAHYAWRKLHEAMFWTRTVRKKINPYLPAETSDAAVDRFCTTLKESGGKFTTVTGLGYAVMICREVSEEDV